MAKKLTTGEFIKRAIKVHDYTYDYSLVEYIDTRTKVSIICKIHGVFECSPNNHIRKRGCPECGNIQKSVKQRSCLKEFTDKAENIHGSIYDYSLVKYINAHTEVKIICKIHGVFYMSPNSHLSNHPCPKCSGNQKLTTGEFIKRATKFHGDTYDYSLVEYINIKTKINIICNIHGNFNLIPEKHLGGQGCYKCKIAGYSKMALKWLNYISEKENIYIQHAENMGEYKINIPNKKFIKVDGYHKETNTVYEFLGDYWHGNPVKYLSEDINPTTKKTYGECYNETTDRLKLLENLGYNVISIWESDWNKLNIQLL